jgi:hypothetical protein
MSNHFHLLLETREIEVGKFMKALASKYAMQYNHRYSYKGHVFEDRYRSCLVETDEYFLQTSRYIHLNPVKANMVEHPEDYNWSSYRSILGICIMHGSDSNLEKSPLSLTGWEDGIRLVNR